MIHYINGVPAQNIRTIKAKRHALAAYRHTQRVTVAKNVAATMALFALFTALLYTAMMITN